VTVATCSIKEFSDHGVVMQTVHQPTYNQEIEGSTPGQALLTMTLGKLLTPQCLCHQAL